MVIGLALLYCLIVVGSCVYLGSVIISTFSNNREILIDLIYFGRSVIDTRYVVDGVRDNMGQVLDMTFTARNSFTKLELDESIVRQSDCTDQLEIALFSHKATGLLSMINQINSPSINFQDSQTRLNFSLSLLTTFHMINMIAKDVSRISGIILNSSPTKASLTTYQNALRSSALFVLVNSLSEVLPSSTDDISSIKSNLLAKEQTFFKVVTAVYFAAFIFLIVVASLFLLFIQYKLNKKMFSLISTYTLMTMGEVRLHQDIIAANAKLLSQHRYVESSLLNQILFQKNKSFVTLHSKNTDRRAMRIKSLNNDSFTKSFKVGVLCTLVIAAYFAGVGILAYAFSNLIGDIFSLQSLYVDHVLSVIDLNNRVGFFGSRIIFGKYLARGGQFTDSDMFDSAIQTFSDFWVSNSQFHKKMLGSRYQDIHNYLYSDICVPLPDDSSLHTAQKNACRASISSSTGQGLLYFLLNWETFMDTTMSTFSIQFSSELSAIDPNSRRTNFIGADLWFESSVRNMTTTYMTATYFFYKLVSDRLKEVADAAFLNLDNSIPVYLAVIITCLFVVVLFVLLLKIKFYSEDWTICFETFKTISPQCVASNAYILNVYKHIFVH